MSTHVPGNLNNFEVFFFICSHHYVLAKLATTSIMIKKSMEYSINSLNICSRVVGLIFAHVSP